mgnify:CR=1 FL=1
MNARQAFGATVLAWAANRNDLEMGKLLIGAGADVNAADVYGVAPLSLACTNGNATMPKELLDLYREDQDPDVRDRLVVDHLPLVRRLCRRFFPVS